MNALFILYTLLELHFNALNHLIFPLFKLEQVEEGGKRDGEDDEDPTTAEDEDATTVEPEELADTVTEELEPYIPNSATIQVSPWKQVLRETRVKTNYFLFAVKPTCLY